jgi:hypothetical protein
MKKTKTMQGWVEEQAVENLKDEGLINLTVLQLFHGLASAIRGFRR